MKNLIMDMFNVDLNDIDKFTTSNNDDGSVDITIRLKKRYKILPSLWM